MSTAFEPVAAEAAYPAPRARIHADRSRSWFRRLWPILLAHRGLLLTSIGSLIGVVLVGVASPWIIMQTIDSAILGGTTPRWPLSLWIEAPPGSDRYPIVPFVIVLGALACLQPLLGYISGVMTSRANQSIEYHLRAIIFEHLGRLSFSFFDRTQSGQLISRANSDIRAVQMFLAFTPRLAVSVLSFGLSLGIMLYESFLLALVALLAIPGVYVLGLSMRSKLFPISWVIQSRMADVATIVEENVSGVRIVKSFSAEPRQIGLLATAAERLRWANVKQVDIRALYAPILQCLPQITRALLLGFGGWLVVRGEATVGVVLAFNIYIVRLQAPFRMVGFLMIMAQRAAASAHRIFEILDEVPEIRDAPDAVDLREPRGEVELCDVRFGYGRAQPVLNGLSIHIRPGETVALVGQTGSGKSTLARLLPRFYDIDSGRILIDGRDIRTYTVASLRAHIGLVLDEPFLFSDSIRNNIAYGRPDAPLDLVKEAARSAGAHEFIQALDQGYDTVVGERGYTLSGGQRQRIAIARTLLVNPKLLILDDATSSVDVRIEQQIHAALSGLMQGRTTLIIAHRLSTIRLADRVVMLSGGQIVADGTHEDLLRSSKEYREILSRADAASEAAA